MFFQQKQLADLVSFPVQTEDASVNGGVVTAIMTVVTTQMNNHQLVWSLQNLFVILMNLCAMLQVLVD